MASDELRSLDKLRELIRTHPIVDHHAHNISKLDQLISEDLLSITSEAAGPALRQSRTALPHLRASKQLTGLLELASGSTWDDIVQARTNKIETDLDNYLRQCLVGTHTILIDDGYDDADVLQSWDWHSRFTSRPCRQIMRLDSVASDILAAMDQKGNLHIAGSTEATEEQITTAWSSFLEELESIITKAAANPDVAGFKSGVGFSTGLRVQVATAEEMWKVGRESFQNEYLPTCRENDFEIEAKGMNDAIIVYACNLLAKQAAGARKPLQFHTGFGGANITIVDSNAALLQPLTATYPDVPIVILHASYPFTREAGLLAALFHNCFLDLSAVFPEVSEDGQERILRQCLELAPWEKLLWSTDGHAQPETFYIANVQGRHAMEKVLCEYVERGQYTVQEALAAAEAILYGNSHRLYRLGMSVRD